MTAPTPAETAPATPEELAARIDALVHFDHDGGEDGYSRSADALWQAALLAFEYAAREVGATGFQGGWAALRFLGEALPIKGPFGIVKAENALYPQYDEVGKVRDWLHEWRPWLAEEAQKLLDERRDVDLVHPSVRAHWQRLAAEGGAR